jgi:oxidase EvaA
MPFLEYFLGDSRGRVLVDQLQSEQGSRYFRKRNRNMIVELPDDAPVPDGGEFAWLSLDQIRELLAAGNFLNMNARSVLSCIRYEGTPADIHVADPWRRAVLESHLAGADDGELQRVLAWLADFKTATRMDVRRVKLSELDGWICDRESIRHESGRFFQIVGVNVAAESREIGAWSQPMFAPSHAGHIAFLAQMQEGVLRVLVQARAEPGFLDSVELGATMQFTRGNYSSPASLPPFAEYLDGPARIRALQSEDGGRFYHDDTTNLVVEVPEAERLELPPNYRWVTLGLLKRLSARGYYVDIEARSLLACLG